AGMCASLAWLAGPAVGVSSYQVRFWEAGKSTSAGPLSDPDRTVTSFVRMTCCESMPAVTLTKTAVGTFHVTNVRFFPGDGEVVVQLKKGACIEKQAVPLTVSP